MSALATAGSSNPNYKHGHSVGGRRSPTFDVWTQMMQRCGNPKNKGYWRYGARGIEVCDRWRNFQAFLLDMGEKPAGMSIERVDNTKGYSPENCVWATPAQQCRNRSVNRFITIDGETMTLTDWCVRFGLNYFKIHSRITKLGWDPVRALTQRGDARRRRANGHA